MKTVEVPTFKSGIVIEPPSFDICMEKVEFVLVTKGEFIRLTAGNEDAHSVLSKHKGTRMPVSVAGYWRQGVECRHLEIYHAAPLFGDNSVGVREKPKGQGVGSSLTLDYAEALRGAIDDAKSPSEDPNLFERYDVVETWVEDGGFTGFTTLFVKVQKRT